jgi:hypothetical protein
MAQQAEAGKVKQQFEELKEKSNDAEDMARKLKMVPPQQRLQMLEMLRQENPDLYIEVAKWMTGGEKSKVPGDKVVNMKPLPEQNPPSRTDKPV